MCSDARCDTIPKNIVISIQVTRQLFQPNIIISPMTSTEDRKRVDQIGCWIRRALLMTIISCAATLTRLSENTKNRCASPCSLAKVSTSRNAIVCFSHKSTFHSKAFTQKSLTTSHVRRLAGVMGGILETTICSRFLSCLFDLCVYRTIFPTICETICFSQQSLVLQCVAVD